MCRALQATLAVFSCTRETRSNDMIGMKRKRDRETLLEKIMSFIINRSLVQT